MTYRPSLGPGRGHYNTTPFPSTNDNSNKENVDPHQIPNIHDDIIDREVSALKLYLTMTPTFSIPTVLNMPRDFPFENTDVKYKTSYWKLTMSALLLRNAKPGSYKGYSLEYIEVGPDNARHFIGYSEATNEWIIADTKKKLFGKMV